MIFSFKGFESSKRAIFLEAVANTLAADDRPRNVPSESPKRATPRTRCVSRAPTVRRRGAQFRPGTRGPVPTPTPTPAPGLAPAPARRPTSAPGARPAAQLGRRAVASQWPGAASPRAGIRPRASPPPTRRLPRAGPLLTRFSFPAPPETEDREARLAFSGGARPPVVPGSRLAPAEDYFSSRGVTTSAEASVLAARTAWRLRRRA